MPWSSPCLRKVRIPGAEAYSGLCPWATSGPGEVASAPVVPHMIGVGRTYLYGMGPVPGGGGTGI